MECAPMALREFEVLLALCKAAPSLRDGSSAVKLAKQLAPYLLEAPAQVFVPSPFFRQIEPSPNEALSYNVTSALLSLGINHNQLQNRVSESMWAYLSACSQTAENIASMRGSATEQESPFDLEDAIDIATLTISILGFLDAAATYANFWPAPERLELIEQVKHVLSEEFLVSVETAFSTLRNSHSHDKHVKEWKRYVKHYAAIGRPLGAMLLQRSFMWLLVAGSSLLVANVDDLRGVDVLDLMMVGGRKPVSHSSAEVSFKMVETIAGIASDEMNLLEDGADYLRLGSAWQQRLAFAVKACALTSYLNCSILNEDAADADDLMKWLEDTLADPIQMADETLASVVLRCMALISKLSPEFAPSVSRLLPRYIVQGGPRGKTVAIASSCLAYVLRILSQDAVIATLYSLGNVLSSGGTEKALTGAVNGDLNTNGNLQGTLYSHRHSTGSAISLAISGEEETTIVYGNVVVAICGIASSCDDDKITGLAQSILLQKITLVSKAVDARIITESAVLALSGGTVDFRSLLKMYARISHDGVAENNDLTLGAVSLSRVVLSVENY